MGIPGLAEDTKPGEESRMAPEGNHEAETLVGLLDQTAGWVGEGSIGESTVAVEILGDLGDEEEEEEVAAAAAGNAAVGSAGSAVEVEREVAPAAVGFELDALTKECRLDEHSA